MKKRFHLIELHVCNNRVIAFWWHMLFSLVFQNWTFVDLELQSMTRKRYCPCWPHGAGQIIERIDREPLRLRREAKL